MANSLLIIDLSGANHAPPLFSVIDEAFGGCDDGLDLRVQAIGMTSLMVAPQPAPTNSTSQLN